MSINRTDLTVKKLIGLITILYLLLLLYWMFIGFGRSGTQWTGYRYNLVPMRTIRLYFDHADSFTPTHWLVNIVGNVAVFVPFGLSIPYLFRVQMLRLTLLSIGVLFVLELLQLLLHRGSYDIDDILLNTIGVLVGAGIYSIIRRRVS
ncbi:VanZ family protein [Paenibacillus sp. CF384]|uniref:VanZ family protein n=1 Tax=Paenibacillus sp. CF384 TaxID=1884382 RepID=UPI000899A3AD|nr:VanZ family protein [Paenibacillus sp. CF384]SDW54628.1 VanZ like family protein [Paenibacillus sp. CF384]